MYRKTAAGVTIAALLLVLTGCQQEADDVNKNLSKDADNFKVDRKVTFVNGITDRVLLEVTGKCSVDPGDSAKMTVTCKTDDGKYVKHFLGKSDNVFWTVEQMQPSDTSASHYHFVVRPGAIIPDVDLNTTK